MSVAWCRRTATPATSTHSISRAPASSSTVGRSSSPATTSTNRPATPTWRVVGDGPCTVFIATRGAMEYLDDDGSVIRRDTTTMRETYERFCESEGVEIADLEG
jgi:hypothetical protein